jgi:hypothetical protein
MNNQTTEIKITEKQVRRLIAKMDASFYLKIEGKKYLNPTFKIMEHDGWGMVEEFDSLEEVYDYCVKMIGLEIEEIGAGVFRVEKTSPCICLDYFAKDEDMKYLDGTFESLPSDTRFSYDHFDFQLLKTLGNHSYFKKLE